MKPENNSVFWDCYKKTRKQNMETTDKKGRELKKKLLSFVKTGKFENQTFKQELIMFDYERWNYDKS